jgi:hypothetical protein
MPVNSKQDYYFLETSGPERVSGLPARQPCGPALPPMHQKGRLCGQQAAIFGKTRADGAAGGYFSPAPGSSSVAPSESAMKP